MEPTIDTWKIEIDGEKRIYQVTCYKEDGHRYLLEFKLKTEKIKPQRRILAILLNPSKATSVIGDKTSKNLLRLLKEYTDISLCNLYSHSSSKQIGTQLDNETANLYNDNELRQKISEFNEIFCGWGEGNLLPQSRDKFNRRIKEISELLKNKTLWRIDDDLVKGKYPRHPARISKTRVIRNYDLGANK